MIPARYDIEIYRGDTYYGPLITLPDLSPFGGPSDLSGSEVEVSAQIRTKGSSGTLLAVFDVEVIDEAARQIRVTLAPTDSAANLPKAVAYWDLEVSDTSTGWVGTPLAGEVAVSGEVTLDA